MERDGLVVVSEDRHLELTPEGLAIATRVMRKHRLAERLLTDVIGLELPFVHEEACRWEHVMSDRVERRLVEMLDSPDRSPYGNPIPGLDELGLPLATPVSHEVSALEATNSGVTRVMLTRIGENPQTLAGFLDLAHEMGLLPGVTLELEASDETVTLATSTGAVTIPADAARHIFVVRMSESA
jgi:DtxR family Mn-dependent transcriptional regulator